MSKARISVILSMADTGFDAESDWDLWTAYVTEYLADRVGEPVDVDAVAWSRRGSTTGPDVVRTAKSVGPVEHEALAALVRDAIQRLWDDGDWWYDTTEAKAEKAAEDAKYAAAIEAEAEAHERAVEAGGYNGPEDG